MSRGCVCSLLAVLLAAVTAGGGGKKKEPPPLPGVKVTLRCSLEGTLNPLEPGKHGLECVVRNDSDRPIRVPLIYTGNFRQDMALLCESFRHPLNLVFWGGPKEQKTAELKPGEERTVFKETLREVLLLDAMEKKGTLIPGEKRYYWNWIA
ncbi:MAG: hypothetical protein U0793_06595 [Gemmataceae bacterium]